MWILRYLISVSQRSLLNNYVAFVPDSTGSKCLTFRHNLANCASLLTTQRNFEMRAWSIAVFLFSSKSFFAKHGLEAYAKEQSAPLTEVSELGTFTLLSIDDVNSVLLTEVNAEYGTHRLLSKESHDLWTAAIDYEWSRARGVESSTSKNQGSLRRTTEIRGTFPYLVCDMEKGKSGESCRSTIEQHFGKDLIVSLLTQMEYVIFFLARISSTFLSCLLHHVVGNISQFATTSIRHAILSAHSRRWPNLRQIFWQ